MFLQQKAFLDAISASLVPQTKVAFASCLCSHFISERKKDPELLEVLGIVGIKRGSPWLAIEVAKELHLPLALHRGEARVNAGYAKPNDFFDGTLPSHGKVMIVDDSITGGTMVLSAIDHLKALHLGVEFCLVLFEVLGKPGRENLKDNGVRLLAICTFDGRTNELANAC
jgi:orotate phosphoribosyltransferase